MRNIVIGRKGDKMRNEVYEIIFKSFTKEDIKEVKESIYLIIENEQTKRKTTLFCLAIRLQDLLYEDIKNNKRMELSANNLTSLIYLKLFFDSIIEIDNDVQDFLPFYTIYRMSNTIDEKIHKYLKMMIEINDLLETSIINVFNNLGITSEEHYIIVSNKIKDILNSYKDDSTNWNKIIKIPNIK